MLVYVCICRYVLIHRNWHLYLPHARVQEQLWSWSQWQKVPTDLRSTWFDLELRELMPGEAGQHFGEQTAFECLSLTSHESPRLGLSWEAFLGHRLSSVNELSLCLGTGSALQPPHSPEMQRAAVSCTLSARLLFSHLSHSQGAPHHAPSKPHC